VQEHIDLRRLPAGLRLEMQYVLQCRGDEQDTRLPPEDVRPFAAVLAAAGVSSLLDQREEWWTARPSRGSGHGWRAFVLDARRRVEALAFGAGWETEYPRDRPGPGFSRESANSSAPGRPLLVHRSWWPWQNTDVPWAHRPQ